jgi:mono/diheme cytochrome c family protein
MRLAVLLAAFVLLGTAPAAAQPAAQPDRGRALVERNCSMCHAIGVSGDSPFRAAPPFRTLSERYKIEDLAEALAEGLITGHPAMPEFRFSPAEVNDIIRYLKAIQVRRSAAEDGPRPE